jgi:polysaccharide export outer membrane protein
VRLLYRLCPSTSPYFFPLAPPPVNSLPPSGVPSRINNFPATPAPAARVIPNRLPPETPYTRGPGDRLKIDVFDVPEYSGEFTVLVDGTLKLAHPWQGIVQGRTLEGATGLLSNTSTDTVASSTPLGHRKPNSSPSHYPRRSGEVNRPGTYTVTPGGGGKALMQLPVNFLQSHR